MRHVLGETEAVWSEILPAQKGVRYTNRRRWCSIPARTQSGCGGARAAMGPFYCPDDKKIYLDTSFFDEMQRKYGGGGDFAYAYVISHEVGHHVQDLLGILDRADEAKQNGSRTQANAISVRIELQADCFAGVWAANANKKWNLLEPGRHRARHRHRAGDRRRHVAEGRARLRRARQLHPRLLGDAAEVVDDRPAERTGRFLRHRPSTWPSRPLHRQMHLVLKRRVLAAREQGGVRGDGVA